MPFKKGQSGNPKGRTTEREFRRALALELKDKNNPRDLRMIARKLIELAASGDMRAIREVADRLEGRPDVIISGDAEKPLVVQTISYTATSESA